MCDMLDAVVALTSWVDGAGAKHGFCAATGRLHCKTPLETRMVRFKVNGEAVSVDATPETPLLWVIREKLNLTGTKFGCGIAQCGACTVHLDGRPLRSCVTPVSVAEGQAITTIEGLAGETLHAVQQAWIEHDVPQCGYCQSGQLMVAAHLVDNTPNPSDEDIDQAMINICRCGTYPRMRSAIHRAAALARDAMADA